VNRPVAGGGPGEVAGGHVLRNTVAVDVGADPVEAEQAMIGAIGDHAAQLLVEARDDRFGIRTAAPHDEMSRRRSNVRITVQERPTCASRHSRGAPRAPSFCSGSS
jgi:hypothetical protein